MKRILYLLFLSVSSCNLINAQTVTNVFPDSGYVGIGATAPDAVLHIEAGANADGNGVVVHGRQPDIVLDQLKANGKVTMGFKRHGNGRISVGMNAGDDLYFTRYSSGWHDESFVIKRVSGNVGIGTGLPTQTLDVRGNILTTGVVYVGDVDTTLSNGYSLVVNGEGVFPKAVVRSYPNWPDYVFDSNYELPPLYSVESYLKERKHLPETPTASEIEKEGMDLADNQAIILKKIEELTLYIIQHQKEIDGLKKK